MDKGKRMFENKIQKHFLYQVNGLNKITAPKKNPIQIYKDMVHYRFIEVIKNALPIFSKEISRKRLNKLVFKFIQSNPKTPYIWKMPFEFRTFILKNKLLQDMPYLADLLLFEWIEIELFMNEYKKKKSCKFSWKKNLSINDSARLYAFDYPVYKEKYKKRGKYHLLVYYDFDDHEVHFQEITEFMYLFLKSLKKHDSKSALKKVSKNFGASFKDTKKLLKEPLNFFCNKKILKDIK